MRKLFFVIFLFISFCSGAQTQLSPQDCIGGIPICSNVYYQNTAYSGYGNYNELQYDNGGCLYSGPVPGEISSVWYIITVNSPGLLEFTLTPNGTSGNDTTIDYDWALWDITNNGCYSIYNYTTGVAQPYPPVRCNASGVLIGPNPLYNWNPSGITGMSPIGCCASAGPGSTDSFSSPLAVTAGQIFALCVNDYTNALYPYVNWGYVLDFSNSTAGIFDTVRPKMDTIGTICGPTDSINFNMTEAIRCTSLDANGSCFYITPSVANVTASNGGNCPDTDITTTAIGLKFSTILPPGNYVLHAQVGTDSNTVLDKCNNAELTTDSMPFTIVNRPVLNLPLYDTTCFYDSIQLNAIPANAVSGLAYTYQWSPDQYISSITAAAPKVSPPVNMKYYVTVSSEPGQCSATDSTEVVMLSNDFTLFNQDTSICLGGQVQINGSGSPFFAYFWSPIMGVSNPDTLDAVLTPTTTTEYTVTAAFPGCPPMSHSINVNVQTPVADITTPDTTLCARMPLQLNATANPDYLAFTYSWNPATGLSDPTVLQPVLSAQTPGIYQYFLTITTPLGCSNTDSVTINILHPITLVIDPVDTTINYGSRIQLNVSDAYGQILYYIWLPNDGSLSNPNIADPIATPLDSVTYQVIGMNTEGCRDSGIVTVHIAYDETVGMPNAFSPNGDGKNDVFRIVNIKYNKLIDFRIFNRWGEVVFQTTDPARGWDGTYNGVPQDLGTYDYMIEVVQPDGTEKMYRGIVTLVR